MLYLVFSPSTDRLRFGQRCAVDEWGHTWLRFSDFNFIPQPISPRMYFSILLTCVKYALSEFV